VAKFTTKFDADDSLIPWFISLEHFIAISDFAFCQLMNCAKVVDDPSKNTLDVLTSYTVHSQKRFPQINQ
jgi:hypothetical protein